MKTSNFLLIGVVLFLITGSSFTYSYLSNNNGRIVYIDLNRVVSEFKLTKELEAKLAITSEKRQNLMDSLKLDLELLSRKVNLDRNNSELQAEFIAKRNDYAAKSNEFTKDNEYQSQEYNRQVFSQINQYVDDFRKERGYSIVLGTSGDGTVMSGDETCNVTEIVSEYINQKYAGKK